MTKLKYLSRDERDIVRDIVLSDTSTMTEPYRGTNVIRRSMSVARETARRLRQRIREGRTAGHLPPVSLRDIGPGDFERVGQEFLGHFIALGKLQPAESVLDIGCGPGRMAIPLTTYLNNDGRYVGMDVVAKAVHWCQAHLPTRHPGFSFRHMDVFNLRYNPGGQYKAIDYPFPLDSDSFDFVFLTSVFTHMYPNDIQHYLDEIARLLRPGGRVLSTWFLLNETQRRLAAEGRSQIDLRFDRGSYRIRDAAVPESAVGVDETLVHELFSRSGLAVQSPIRYGRWNGRTDGLSFQDIIVSAPTQ